MTPPPDPPYLHYGHPSLDESDIAAVTAVLRGGWLTTGPAVAAFERAFAVTVGADHAVACSNGTAALHLALLALGLGPGDAAVVPAITFVATANAVAHVGATVIFADVDPATGLMEPEHLERALAGAAKTGARVRAVLPVHFAGQPADRAGLAAVAAAHDLTVVEDACHALGATDPAGPIGHNRPGTLSVFSLHPVKSITAGEGGVITTDDPAHARTLAALRSHGLRRDPAAMVNRALAVDPEDGTPNPWYYEAPAPGFNYRLSDLNCALAHSQLRRLPAFVAHRDALARRYDDRLAPLASWVRPLARRPGVGSAWHLYVVRLDFPALGWTRGRLMRALHDRGIGTQVHYIPVPLQPCWRARAPEQAFPGALDYYARCLTLPLHAAMGIDDVDRVVDALAQVQAQVQARTSVP